MLWELLGSAVQAEIVAKISFGPHNLHIHRHRVLARWVVLEV